MPTRSDSLSLADPSLLVSAPPAGFVLRMTGVGVVVFLANAGLLVLQLVAGRLLSPFVGSSLETWTTVIASFLAGIAVGNAVGGRVADRGATGGKLAFYLALGAFTAGWMIAIPVLLASQGWHKVLPLGPRIPVLAFVLCFPVAFALSVLTPLAIRFVVPDVSRSGLVAGWVFGLSTLGCLLGNYLTGFVLIPEWSVNQIVIAVASLLGVTAAAAFGWTRAPRPAEGVALSLPHPAMPLPEEPTAPLSLPRAFATVFLCSFAGMTLELSATRLLAPLVGVSLYTWTGVIGVMLAGTCLGNWLGGILAGGSTRTTDARKLCAAVSMLVAGLLTVVVIILFGTLSNKKVFDSFGLVEQILLWTFSLFFLPMLLLGTISPQIIRLAVPNIERAGNTAGRVYAWSTAGAIVGTFATGYFLISTLGVLTTLLLTALLPCLASLLVASPRHQPVMLYTLCAVAGALFGGAIVLWRVDYKIEAESNYYTIIVNSRVGHTYGQWPMVSVVGPAAVLPRELRFMNLDHLTHSVADLNDPTFLHYEHEQIQLEAVYAAKMTHPNDQRVLVIGGGGYTFPRCVKTLIPTANVEVVEIDPMVTKVAVQRMGFDPKLATIHHMDGRQFVAERATAGTYHVVTLDAVNDYSVPYHLLTRECNDAVKRTLTPDGVYLVTVIDEVYDGQLWKAAYHTLKESFAHVSMVFPKGLLDPENPQELERSVIILYASDRPLSVADWSTAHRQFADKASNVYAVPEELVVRMLAVEPDRVILTDQYAPVDNLMMRVFRRQYARPEEESKNVR